MELVWSDQAGEMVTALAGMCLDSFSVSGATLQLCLLRLPQVQGLPDELWLSTTCPVFFRQADPLASRAPDDEQEFYASRERALVAIFRLNACEILNAVIHADGSLELRFETGSVVVVPDDPVDEVFWEVGDRPPSYEHGPEWLVLLSETATGMEFFCKRS
ncbi:MAG: hypothetical protein AB7O39_07940 [Flavobacteriaceae bacterium]